MPLFMDIHRHMVGATPDTLRAAHAKDLEVQGRHGVEYVKYWYNDKDGTVFCLCNAPNREAAEAVHREAHGAIADEIIEVREGA